MSYESFPHEDHFLVRGSSGVLLKDGGAGDRGEALRFSTKERADAKAAWLNLDPSPVMMSKKQRRQAREMISEAFGIPYDVAIGLLN